MTKILIVDDEPLIRRSMQKTLTRAGYDVEAAENCSDGLSKFQAAQATPEPFQLAVLDLNMPGFDGVEISGAGLQLLSRLVELRAGFPVIILSAYDEINKAKDAVARGAKGYCVKGREESLLDEIKKILNP